MLPHSHTLTLPPYLQPLQAAATNFVFHDTELSSTVYIGGEV